MSKRLWDKGQELNKQVHAFTVGSDYLLDARLAAFDAAASAAHARMLLKIEILTVEECLRLIPILKEIYTESRAGSFTVPPELEDCHSAIEARLCEQLGDCGKKIHTGRSRNDQVLAALRLFMREQIVRHQEQLLDLAKVLMRRAEEAIGRPFPGYTHMRRAMPTSLATQLFSYAQYALSLIKDGLHLLEGINWNPLGVGAGFGVPLELDREMTGALLGFDAVQPNPIFVQSTRGREELKFLNWLVDSSTLTEKMAVDLMLFSTAEFGLAEMPVKFTTGSSIMPQKRNPDVLELLRAQASRQRAHRTELEGLVSKLPSSYHRDYQYTKEPLFRAAEQSAESLAVLCLLIEDIQFNREAAEAYFGPEIFSTHYAYELVSKGVPFRDAYTEAASAIEQGLIDVPKMMAKFLELESARNRLELKQIAELAVDIGTKVATCSESHCAALTKVFEG
ncbi:MAG: argininosuccinate lyase [Proteobacteria bacterium]|nr:MAG: argininosuccinate lyase [Pseudomonadota bacterium]